MKSLKITALSLVLVLLLAACGAKNDTPDEPAVDPTPEPPIEQPVEKTPDERINDIIAGMSLEEKVGQLFFVRCPETGAAEDVETYHLGGLLLFGRDYKDANGDWLTEDDFTAALASYQAAAAIPLFIGSDEEGGTVTRASKNPNLFSEPLPSPQELYAAGGLDGLLKAERGEIDPLTITADQYDLVCNGVELSSGAVRNHDPEIMIKAFELVRLGEEDVKAKFPAMYNAFCYGAPPHAGIAPGVDRMVMLLAGEDSIREIIPFPMNKNAQDIMMGAPSEVTQKQLDELHIAVTAHEEE